MFEAMLKVCESHTVRTSMCREQCQRSKKHAVNLVLFICLKSATNVSVKRNSTRSSTSARDNVCPKFYSTFGFTLSLDRSGSCMGAAALLPILPGTAKSIRQLLPMRATAQRTREDCREPLREDCTHMQRFQTRM